MRLFAAFVFNVAINFDATSVLVLEEIIDFLGVTIFSANFLHTFYTVFYTNFNDIF